MSQGPGYWGAMGGVGAEVGGLMETVCCVSICRTEGEGTLAGRGRAGLGFLGPGKAGTPFFLQGIRQPRKVTGAHPCRWCQQCQWGLGPALPVPGGSLLYPAGCYEARGWV